ncbi:MAG TPA: hypothetical protein VM532_12310 [Burkholderiales bacterium]|jgi:hypothetical protein|nr:hypothetical protein [Burkholderiales bacterium]
MRVTTLLNLKPAVAQDDPVSQIGEVLMQALGSYQRSLAKSNKSVTEDLNGQIRLLGQSNLGDHQSLETSASKNLKALLKKRLDENENHHDNLLTALDQAQGEIKALFK